MKMIINIVTLIDLISVALSWFFCSISLYDQASVILSDGIIINGRLSNITVIAIIRQKNNLANKFLCKFTIRFFQKTSLKPAKIKKKFL